MPTLIDSLISHLDIVSFFVGVFSIFLGYWFWRNPISTDFINESIVEDQKGNIKYIVGHDHQGWKVKRLNYNENGELKTNIASWANRKNNPETKSVLPKTAQLDNLNFD
jgi:hypothetical protein